MMNVIPMPITPSHPVCGTAATRSALRRHAGALAATALLGLTLLGAAPAARADEQLANGGFESGLSGWTASGTVSLESTDTAAGSLAAVLADENASLSLTLDTAIDVSTIVQLGFQARSDAGVLSLIVLSYADGSTSGTDVSIFDLGNSAWTGYDLSTALKAGASLTGLTIYGSSAGATLIDAVTLQTTGAIGAVPEPASAALALGGAGLLLAVAGRRRANARG
jgi:hypothetical protein